MIFIESFKYLNPVGKAFVLTAWFRFIYFKINKNMILVLILYKILFHIFCLKKYKKIQCT